MSIDSRGLRNLAGVHPTLGTIVRRVAETCPVALTIIDGGGLRTPAQAANNAARDTGVKNSMHLPQHDGYSWAVDLLPVDASGSPYWDELAARVITPHVLAASDELLTPLQNGADWDVDGKYGESGPAAQAGNEYDWHHYQFPIAKRMDGARIAMQRRLAARATLHQLPTIIGAPTDSRDAVMRLQASLGGLKVDGAWGPATRRRLVAFQQLARTADPLGVCGQSTWGALVA